MSMLFAYLAGGEGVGLEVLKCFVRGGSEFFLLCFVCVCGGSSGSVSLLPLKNNRTPPINK